MGRGFWLAGVVLALSLASVAGAAQLAGKYQGDTLGLELISSGNDDYSGTIHLGSQQFPLKAHSTGAHISGTFTSQGANFKFDADMDSDVMTLTSSGMVYTLHRQSDGPVNPLANPAAQDNPPPHVDAAPGKAIYTVLASNDSGQTVFIQRPEIKSVLDAVTWADVNLAKQFDARPAISKAYVDSQENHRGMASFIAKVKGKEVKGLMLVGIGDNGAAITITYARDDAPGADIAALTNAMPTDAKWSSYELPDNTGTLKIADGWQVKSANGIGSVLIVGPADQMIDLCDGAEVITPDSMAAQMMAQAQQQAKMFGGPPPPASTLFVAPFTGPVEALKNLVPQISARSQQAGQPAITLDKIITTVPIQAYLPNGQAARVIYSWTKGGGASAVHYRTFGQYETYFVAQGTWGTCFSELVAPDATFDRDLPLMLQMANSLKLNDQAVAQHTQEALQAQNQRFNAFQQAMKEKNDAFDGYMKSVQNNQLIEERSNADFDEVIRGYRTVEDTQTGERGTADIGNVTEIVNKLNEGDPGRYKEIPLRDEMYPKPEGQ